MVMENVGVIYIVVIDGHYCDVLILDFIQIKMLKETEIIYLIELIDLYMLSPILFLPSNNYSASCAKLYMNKH